MLLRAKKEFLNNYARMLAKKHTVMYYKYVSELGCLVTQSPVGPIAIFADDDTVHGVRYLQEGETPKSLGTNEPPAIAQQTAKELREYFSGKRKTFDLPLHWPAASATRKMLEYTASIPAGETRNYAQVAKAAGHAGATRAAGTALRRNPFAIVVPCHRVIRSNGSLGKYAGTDDGRKEKLLAIDRL